MILRRATSGRPEGAGQLHVLGAAAVHAEPDDGVLLRPVRLDVDVEARDWWAARITCPDSRTMALSFSSTSATSCDSLLVPSSSALSVPRMSRMDSELPARGA